MKNKEKGLIKKEECSKCHSKLVYIRLKNNERVCRSCGYIENMEKKLK